MEEGRRFNAVPSETTAGRKSNVAGDHTCKGCSFEKRINGEEPKSIEASEAENNGEPTIFESKTTDSPKAEDKAKSEKREEKVTSTTTDMKAGNSRKYRNPEIGNEEKIDEDSLRFAGRKPHDIPIACQQRGGEQGSSSRIPEIAERRSTPSVSDPGSITRMVTMATPGASHSSASQQRKLMSYSQPLPRSEIPRCVSNLRKKHSLDEEPAASSHPFPLDIPRSFHSSHPASSLPPGPIPEFIGSGGGSGIFRLPPRGAVHPGRPPPLELRPRPLRETQVGAFLHAIACTTSQVWAAQESGLRFWYLSELFDEWKGREMPRRGDEESAPFHTSVRTPAALCLVADVGRGLVWSGHKDGKIRSWRVEQTRMQMGSLAPSPVERNEGGAGFKEVLSWQAHRAPVLSMVFTSYGELWSGSQGGNIRAWPSQAIENSLSRSVEERHMAALLVERSCVDLKSLVTVEGECPLSSANVLYLLSDDSRAKVWSSSSLSFALWDSRKKELLRVFSLNGEIETRSNALSPHNPNAEVDVKTKVSCSSKKEKSQGSSFLQRSRNALMGAADAVRRVASKGAFGDDNRRIEAMVITLDGIIWTGYTNGSLVQWDANGNKLHEVQHHSASVTCLCTFASRLWVGYANGTVQVMDLEGYLIGGWIAHNSPVMSMAIEGLFLFTLGNLGGIRGWYLASPGPLDNALQSELASKEMLYTKFENVKILAGTWNVGQERASHNSLITWLGTVASEVGMVAIGLQEVDMGAGFLAVSAAKESVGLEGSSYGQWWLDNVGKTLDEGTSFERVGSRQLAGLLIAIWARRNLVPHIGDVDAAAVACGLGRAIGNKGAVGLRIRVYDRILCFVNCHFAAHLEAVSRRNADFNHVYRSMAFIRPPSGGNAATACASNAQMHRWGNATDTGRPELSEADMIIFLGDFNYRLYGITFDEARDLVSQRCFDWLREKDQLREEMRAGKVFQGLREGDFKFPPTYKFQRHQAGFTGYDSSEKKRIPAWCDRILYRDNRSVSLSDCSLECPVVASILQYEACMDVTDSDHKPVRCIFSVDIARLDKLTRRRLFGEIIVSNGKFKSLLEEYQKVPETVVSTTEIFLANRGTSFLRVTNKCLKDKATFEILCERLRSKNEDGQDLRIRSRGSFGFPNWLKISPVVGIIKPGETINLSVQHENLRTLEDFIDDAPQHQWTEDTLDSEVLLILKITGSRSTECRTHLIHVRRTFKSNEPNGHL
ncbi:Type II inositol 1,4,5-trisphosphate 5-phosphatase FRA3 [Apostasia shenzhenica]|uniref:Type II inositol 1,4,5-trisphosphate 5-phosphatase FRA3 n=1 Tax=Apostasia shenzhenica TaxID=1088818 RepID=A0A2I0AQK6_9ASPA|nr:Type II inositol 1,4,5-trisphosphate 5-phosphatase FRA3 [Apostasia shenzhenica]